MLPYLGTATVGCHTSHFWLTWATYLKKMWYFIYKKRRFLNYKIKIRTNKCEKFLSYCSPVSGSDLLIFTSCRCFYYWNVLAVLTKFKIVWKLICIQFCNGALQCQSNSKCILFCLYYTFNMCGLYSIVKLFSSEALKIRFYVKYRTFYVCLMG